MKIRFNFLKCSILFLMLINLNLYSQENRNTKFIIKGGINRTTIIGVDQNNDKTGFVGIQIFGGLLFETKLKEKLFLEQGLIFSYTDEYNFIEIPVELKVKIDDKFSIKFGPQLDFIINNIEENSIFYYFKTFGISSNLGLEYNLNKSFLVDVNFTKGFVEQVNDKILDINNGKRNIIRLGLGYKF